MNFSEIEKQLEEVIGSRTIKPKPGFRLLKGFFTIVSHQIFPLRLTASKNVMPLVAMMDSNSEIHFFSLKDLIPDLNI